MTHILRDKVSGLILDMDGVLYRGTQPLPGARQLFPALREAGLAFILLTNNATLTAEEYTARLGKMGIVVPPEAILTTAGATATYLQQNYPQGGGIYVLGEPPLVRTLGNLPNFRLDGWNPDFVVVGLYYKFDYDSLQRACSAIRRGARFIATNTDATLPVEGGEVWPGAGSIVAAVKTCAGVEPVVIGKPSTYMAELALSRIGLPPEQVLCVGDRLETDILMGARAGMLTALVLTGVSTREDIEKAPARPDYVFDDLPDLMRALNIGSGGQV
jgi:4-nitrophenyl phosphatase